MRTENLVVKLRDGEMGAHVAYPDEMLERRLSPNPLVAIHKYPDADHAFARHGGRTYRKAEADRALDLSVKFFRQHLA